MAKSKIILKFPDGSKKEYTSGITAREIAEKISAGLAREALSAKLGERVIELEAPIEEDGEFPDIPKEMPIYTHCEKGGRAQRAVKALKEAGFENVKSIGGTKTFRK